MTPTALLHGGARAVVRGLALASWLMASATAMAQPISMAELQTLLQAAPRTEVRFTESRESPWLSAPVQSSGTMKATPTLLEKRVEQPRRETWRILADRMQWESDAGATKEILFADTPAVAALANALRHVMAGDLAALDKDFQLVTDGTQRLWTVRLTPRNTGTSRTLRQLDLQGSNGQLLVLIVLESRGERTTTRLEAH